MYLLIFLLIFLLLYLPVFLFIPLVVLPVASLFYLVLADLKPFPFRSLEKEKMRIVSKDIDKLTYLIGEVHILEET